MNKRAGEVMVCGRLHAISANWSSVVFNNIVLVLEVASALDSSMHKFF